MKLASYRIDVAAVPYETGRRATHVVLRLRASDGVEGLGYTTLVTADAWLARALVPALEEMTQRVVGRDPLETEAINQELLSLAGGGPMTGLVRRVASVIDIALWDIKGKVLGQPVHRLLGSGRDRVRAYAGYKLWWTYDLDALAKHAREFVDQGFRAMKYRLGGIAGPAVAAERTRVLREAVGDGVDLLADANQSWDVPHAIAIGRALEPYRLFWLEDPIANDNLGGIAAVASAVGITYATGETYHDLESFRRLLERNAAGVAIVDLDVGGITQWMKVAHLAEAFRIPVAGHTAPEILVHTLAAASNGLIVECLPWAFALFKEPPALVDGDLVAPDRPGLGLELDETALARFKA